MGGVEMCARCGLQVLCMISRCLLYMNDWFLVQMEKGLG